MQLLRNFHDFSKKKIQCVLRTHRLNTWIAHGCLCCCCIFEHIHMFAVCYDEVIAGKMYVFVVESSCAFDCVYIGIHT